MTTISPQLDLAMALDPVRLFRAATGLTPDELTAHIGAATVRRIVEFKGQPGLLVNAHRPTAGR